MCVFRVSTQKKKKKKKKKKIGRVGRDIFFDKCGLFCKRHLSRYHHILMFWNKFVYVIRYDHILMFWNKFIYVIL